MVFLQFVPRTMNFVPRTMNFVPRSGGIVPKTEPAVPKVKFRAKHLAPRAKRQLVRAGAERFRATTLKTAEPPPAVTPRPALHMLRSGQRAAEAAVSNFAAFRFNRKRTGAPKSWSARS
ncbi:hypothetical protein C6I21_08615 [Alkalicoccus urumqiensis]|uniref:Uncharacterized protein n=1 Tax=Alkalicoccus urumqiensis TaxID=1548213 RepID=A0A2P6MH20_ALKUR|nr:hypothetical protein C6I21_08615 [Alkalicoccus urumqiensis]